MRGLGGTSRSHHVRPPSYLARAVGALEGLLLEEHREAVLRSHLLEDLPQGRGRGEVGRQRHRKVTNSSACTGQPPAPRRACITTTFWSVCVVTEPNIAADEKGGRPEKRGICVRHTIRIQRGTPMCPGRTSELVLVRRDFLGSGMTAGEARAIA